MRYAIARIEHYKLSFWQQGFEFECYTVSLDYLYDYCISEILTPPSVK